MNDYFGITKTQTQRQLFPGKDIDAQARLFNKTVTNICLNYNPNEYATFNDNDHIRLLIKKTNVAFQKYLGDENTSIN